MRRAGLSLLELLVVVGIIGALAGLLLSAVQKVRAAAARTGCANNLHQIGVALHNHHTTVGRFPPGRGTPTPRIFSASAYLLPHVEQDALRSRIDFTAPPATFNVGATVYDGSINLPAAGTVIPVFVCPSDPMRGRVPGSAYAGTNYAANGGSGQAGSGTLTGADGVFFVGSTVRLDDISDGTSTTAAFSERTLGIGATGPGDLRRVMFELPLAADPTASACAGPSGGVWNTSRGEKWIVGNYGYTIYNHAYPPNPPEWDCTNATQQKGRFAPRSLHPGGVSVLFCDGGVRFVTDNVALPVWRGAATRIGGEVSEL